MRNAEQSIAMVAASIAKMKNPIERRAMAELNRTSLASLYPYEFNAQAFMGACGIQQPQTVTWIDRSQPKEN